MLQMIGLLAGVAFAPHAVETERVQVEFHALQAGVPVDGGAFDVAVHFEIAPSWHLYWQNPGDSGEPPKVRWSLPAGWSVEPLRFPVPARKATGPIINYIFEERLTVVSRLRAPPGEGPAELTGRLSWLVCQEDCIPGFLDFSMAAPRAAEATPRELGLRREVIQTTYAVDGKEAVLAAAGTQLFVAEPGVADTKALARQDGETTRFTLGPIAPGETVTGILVQDDTARDFVAKLTGEAAAATVTQKTDPSGWLPWSSDRVAQLTAAETPTFVRYTADWCVPCKLAEKQVFSTAEGQAALADVTRVVADWTDANAAIEADLKRFERNSIPLYVYHPPGRAPVVRSSIKTVADLRAMLEEK